MYLSVTSSLYRYCIDRLGYAEDAALKRHRVAKLALRVPQVLEELRAGTMNLTGLFVLSKHLTEENAGMLLGQARGKSRREVEELIAHWFPRPDVAPSIVLEVGASGAATCSGAGEWGRIEPLSPARVRVEFTAGAEVHDKIEKARQLLSHALPSGELGELFERALDALIEKESKKRFGSGKPRKSERRGVQKTARPSRYVPVDVERAVWERDGAQCTFVGIDGQRCGERRFLTIEHIDPFALGGLPTLEKLCLLCNPHNLESARRVFGAEHVETKIRERRWSEVATRVLASLRKLGFHQNDALSAIERALENGADLAVEQLLRTSLRLLVPVAS